MPNVFQRGCTAPTGSRSRPALASWTVALIALLAVALSGCSGEDPVVEKRGMVDFIGEVERVEFGPTWAIDRPEGDVTGGPDSATTVGPQLIVLANGDQLDVPAETPGGVYCAELYHPSLHFGFEVDPKNWFSHCVVMGQRTAGGEVAWFEIRRIRTYNESALVDVGYVAEMDTTANTLTTTDGIEFVLTADESDCGEPLGVTAAMRALADWSTGEVVTLICLFDG